MTIGEIVISAGLLTIILHMSKLRDEVRSLNRMHNLLCEIYEVLDTIRKDRIIVASKEVSRENTYPVEIGGHKVSIEYFGSAEHRPEIKPGQALTTVAEGFYADERNYLYRLARDYRTRAIIGIMHAGRTTQEQP